MSSSLRCVVHGTSANEVDGTVRTVSDVLERRAIAARIVSLGGLPVHGGLPWRVLDELAPGEDEAPWLCVPAGAAHDAQLGQALGAALDAWAPQSPRVLWPLPSQTLGTRVGVGLPARIAALLDPPERTGLVLLPGVLGKDRGFRAGCEFVWTSLAASLVRGETWTIGSAAATASALWPDRAAADSTVDENPRDPLSCLVHRPPTPERSEIATFVRSLAPSDIVAGTGARLAAAARVPAAGVQAGILLRHDDFDGSHEVSQGVEGEGLDRDGDYWHAILHRREPDAGNAGYWFRHVGRHPIFPKLARAAEESLAAADPRTATELRTTLALPGRWDPLRFVAACDAARADEASPRALALRRIQRIEIGLLLAHCARNACGA